MQEKDIPQNGAIVSKYVPALDHVLKGSAGVPYNWNVEYDIEKEIAKKLGLSSFSFPVKDQGVSSSCGGNACAYYKEAINAMTTGIFEEESAKFIYAPSSAVGGGTSVYALGNHLTKKGSTSEKLCPSYFTDGTPLTEEQYTAVKDITEQAIKDGLLDLSKSYAQVTTLTDIDSVAQAIKGNYGAILGVTGQNNGTWTTAYPAPPSSKSNNWYHWVYAGKTKTTKKIGELNSWGKWVGENGWQFLGEEYFTSGNIWCVFVVTDFENVIVPEFKYQWYRTLKKGDSNTDVKALQKALKLEGYDQPVTGYFGDITKANLIKFQEKYADKILVPTGLTKGTGVCATFTRQFLNELYA